MRNSSPWRLQNIGFALSIVLAPVAFILGAVFEPAVHITNGLEAIRVNAEANPVTNALHVAGFDLAAFLLPLSVLGMARAAMRGSPWLATLGGALGLIGWLPFAALAAQDDLTLQMAQFGPSDLLGTLWERFNNDVTMSVFLVVYIVGHLLAYVVLPLALLRARIVPRWSAWLLIATTPLTLGVFATRLRSEVVGSIFLGLLSVAFVLGSLPVAYAVLLGRGSEP